MNESRRRSAARGPGRSQAKELFWRRHIEAQARSKRTIRDYCAQAGISEPSFYAWRSELARREAETSRAARGKSKTPQRTATSAPRFLPVVIGSPINAASQPAGPSSSPAPAHVELTLPSGLLIRVPAHDAAALRTVLELLEARSC